MDASGNCQQKQYKSCPSSTPNPANLSCRAQPSNICNKQDNTMSHHIRLLEVVQKVREPLADYQEKRGLPKTEQYGFINLVTSLCQHAYNAMLTIFSMLYNLLPLLEGFLYLARFVLDKLVEICETQEKTDKILKIVLFVGEMVVIVLMVMIICGFILFPVWYLFSHIFGKFWSILITSSGS